ncbi:unnamed protein product [Mucor fragilis]
MEFEEVNNYINRGRGGNNNISNTSLDNIPPFDHAVSNPYNSIIQPIVRKPTLSNFVNRLKQQSSKTRFVEKYKKMSNASDMSDGDDFLIDDNASIRIIDPSRELARDANQQQPPQPALSDDSEVVNLVVSLRKKEKKPVKKVHINESANQVQPSNHVKVFNEPQGSASSDRFVSIQEAIVYINQDNERMQDAIEKEMKKIMIKQEEITKYQEECQWMKTQMDAIHYSISTLLKENIPDMRSVKERVIENEQKVRINKKKNSMQKYRFEKYRKAISIETRLLELEKKIKAAWRRDEIWAGIRDWGFLTVLLFFFLVASIIAWQS